MSPRSRRRPDGVPTFAPEWLQPVRYQAEDNWYKADYRFCKWLLERNVDNRPMNWDRSKLMRDDMIAGDWRPKAADSLKFTSDGRNLNGQKRAWAVVGEYGRDLGDAGLFFTTRIEWDTPDDARRNIDTAQTRQGYLWLESQGVEHAQAIYSMARLGWVWEGRHFRQSGTKGTSHDAVYHWLDKNPGLPAHWDNAVMLNKKPLNISTAVGGVFSYIAWSVASTCYFDFLEGVVRGHQNLHGEQDPRYRLREWTINRQIERKGREAVRHPERLHTMIKAWNYWLQDLPLSRLWVRQNEPFPMMMGLSERGELIEDAW